MAFFYQHALQCRLSLVTNFSSTFITTYYSKTRSLHSNNIKSTAIVHLPPSSRLFLSAILTSTFAIYLARNNRSLQFTKTKTNTTTTAAMPKKLTSSNSSGRFSSSTSASSSSPSPPAKIPQTFTDNLPLPKLFVFDLDYTLWPFWVDTHVTPPVKPSSSSSSPSQPNTSMTDRYGESFSFYCEVPTILYAARQKGITMGLASRTCTPDLAEKMLRGIMVPVPELTTEQKQQDDDNDEQQQESATATAVTKEKPSKAWDFFQYREIFPGSKIKHFNRIQSSTAKRSATGGVAFADMIFFDDEGRNREVETQLGVTFVLVRDGVTCDEVDRGVREWRKRRGVDSVTNMDDGNGVVEEDEF